MKKLILFFMAIVFCGFSAFAQETNKELTNKKGMPILPQKGDIGLGISLTPILDFIGNLTKINSGTTFSTGALWNYVNGNKTIYIKYFLDPTTAVSAKIRLSNNSTTIFKESVQNQKADSTHAIDNTLVVEDSWKHSSSDYILSLGFEKRRGYGRLQGFYGGSLSVGIIGMSKDTYKYGNDISTDYPAPIRTNFGSNYGTFGYVTSNKTSAVFSGGLAGFIGVEYFILPKMSIGGQFGWGFMMNPSGNYGKTETKEEYWGLPQSQITGTAALQTVTVKGGKQHGLSVDNDFSGSSVFLMFHF